MSVCDRSVCLLPLICYAWKRADNCIPPFSTSTTMMQLGLVLLASILHLSVTFSPPHFQQRRHSLLVASSSSESNEQEPSLNELHTMLQQAVEAEDYEEAGRISDIRKQLLFGDTSNLSEEQDMELAATMSWTGLGTAPWLTDRLGALSYMFPTTIQIQTMQAVNAMLNSTQDELQETSLEERLQKNERDMGIVISGSTGSGKTLAYTIPLLSTLSDSLFERQRLRVGAEENVGDATGDLLDRIAVVTSPVVRSGSRPLVQEQKTTTSTSLGTSGTDVTSPLALIVVPTRELGAQTATLLFHLIGGSIKENPTELVGAANSFRYKGPKGIRIGCVLDDEEASQGLKLQTDIVVTTPKYLGKLLDEEDIKPASLRVIAYDEADLSLELTSDDNLSKLFDDDSTDERLSSRLVLLAGASVTKPLGDFAVQKRVLPPGRSSIATATTFAPLKSHKSSGEETARSMSLQDLDVCLYPGLQHERVVVQDGAQLLALTRLLRENLRNYAKTHADERPRAVVFFPSEKEAKDAIEPLRDSLWGEHKVCVMLPEIGVNPLGIMNDFKNSETSVMLATPNSVRGLDFPNVTHVYSLFLPVDDPREYIHLAGRVGRVGQEGRVLGDGGHVVSLIKDTDVNSFDALSSALGFSYEDKTIESEEIVDWEQDEDLTGDNIDVEKARRYLEDTLMLVRSDGDEPNATTTENGLEADAD